MDVEEEEKESSEDEGVEEIVYSWGNLPDALSIKDDKILVHCVAEDGKWINRGTMGQINQAFGTSAQEEYESGNNSSLGVIQIVEITKNGNISTDWNNLL